MMRDVSPAADPTSAVTILLATFQGERFLREQLRTITQQTHTSWSLLVSDDGSTDQTLRILEEFSQTCGHAVDVLDGPRAGFLRNFMHLIAHAQSDSPYYAFCDQDDLWLPQKLEVAVNWLNSQPADVPLLYCARTRNVDQYGYVTSYSPLFRRQPSFRNALVQSIAGGNTMVFNRRMLMLIRQLGTHHELPSHDWWLYVIATGTGGNVFYDSNPTVDYRQHVSNQVGANSTLRAKLRRIALLRRGRFKAWNDQHVEALNSCQDALLPQNQTLFLAFKQMRSAPFPSNLKMLLSSGFYRQQTLDTLGLFAAVLLRRL